jgi:uncharacterized ferredoxin-like protein
VGARELFGQLAQAFRQPAPRDANVDDAVKAVNQAREMARFAARMTEHYDRKLARELHKSADTLNRLAKRMWSL